MDASLKYYLASSMARLKQNRGRKQMWSDLQWVIKAETLIHFLEPSI